MELKFAVYGRIEKPMADALRRGLRPDKLSGYFTTGGASAPLDEGTTVTWDFADFPGAFPVTVLTMDRDRLIVLEWATGEGEGTTQVRVEFEPLDERSTMVRMSEGREVVP